MKKIFGLIEAGGMTFSPVKVCTAEEDVLQMTRSVSDFIRNWSTISEPLPITGGRIHIFSARV